MSEAQAPYWTTRASPYFNRDRGHWLAMMVWRDTVSGREVSVESGLGYSSYRDALSASEHLMGVLPSIPPRLLWALGTEPVVNLDERIKPETLLDRLRMEGRVRVGPPQPHSTGLTGEAADSLSKGVSPPPALLEVSSLDGNLREPYQDYQERLALEPDTLMPEWWPHDDLDGEPMSEHERRTDFYEQFRKMLRFTTQEASARQAGRQPADPLDHAVVRALLLLRSAVVPERPQWTPD